MRVKYKVKNIDILRTIDLYEFIKDFDPYGWESIGTNQIKGVKHDSCIITKAKGWSWFSRGLFSKNSIDFLMRYYELDFLSAVKVLSEHFSLKRITYNHNVITVDNHKKEFSLPTISTNPWRELYAYLCYKRLISKHIIDVLVTEQLLYQTADYYPNICFINQDKKHWELSGTGLTRYKRISDGNQYWLLPFSLTKCYVSESAIDAISLYELLNDKTASYISVGGSLSRTKLIKKIITEFDEVILAIDNDEAGNKTANMFPLLKRILPYSKDFNEDLVIAKTKNKKFEYKITKAGVNYD